VPIQLQYAVFMAHVMVFTHLVLLPARATLAMITLPIPLNAQVIHSYFTNKDGSRWTKIWFRIWLKN